MRILVVCQRYWPEEFQITAICEDLVTRGHEVTVLCGLPNVGVPGSEPGRVLEEYKRGRNRDQEHNGVRIHRSFEVGRRTGVLWRTLNYYSFWKSAEREVMRLGKSFDVVFAYQLSPAMMAVPAVEYGRRTDTPVFLYCCDLWPESMKATLGDKGGPIVRHFGKVCRHMYEGADMIGIQAPGFVGYFEREHGISVDGIVYFPHFSTDVAGEGGGVPLEPHDGVNLIFMGNMGAVQGIDWMIDAMTELGDFAELRLHFVGDGSELGHAKAKVDGLGLHDRVLFHGRRPSKEMVKWYAIADICVLALDDRTDIGLTIPSKLQGYMAAGRPVVGAIGGGARFVIEDSGCGIVVAPGDVSAFAGAIRRLSGDPMLRKELGARARGYYEENFTKEAYVDRLEAELAALGKGRKDD